MAGRLRFFSVISTALLVLLVSIGPASAQLIDMASYLRSIYRDYLGRDPAPEEMSAWVRSMQRGTPASEAQAYIMSSDECFLRNGRDVNAWITQAYRIVIGRQPSPRDLIAWGGRLNTLRGDRLTWSREFLRASNWQSPIFNRPPNVDNPRDLPTRLVTTAQLLSQSVQAELPGNRGWLAQTQANNLLTTAEANRFILARPGNNTTAFMQAMTSLQTNVDALRGTLAVAGASAPTSRQYADQASQLLLAIQDSVPTPLWIPPPNRPIPLPVVNPGCLDQNLVDQYIRRMDDLHRLVIQFETGLKSVYPRTWGVDQLLREVEDFHANLDRFRAMVRVGAFRSELRATLVTLRVQADRISALVRQGQLDRLVIQSWYDTGTAFNGLTEFVGINANEQLSPEQPVPWDVGTGSIPFNLSGPSYQPNRLQGGVPLVDAAISQCDSISTALTPYSFQSPLVSSVQGEIRTLRNSLLDLRGSLAQNAPRDQLALNYRNVVIDARRVEELWLRIQNSPDSPPNLPDLGPFRRALQQANDPAYSNIQP